MLLAGIGLVGILAFTYGAGAAAPPVILVPTSDPITGSRWNPITGAKWPPIERGRW